MTEQNHEIKQIESTLKTSDVAVETHSEQHSGPHIPKLQGDNLGYGISTTVVTTFMFLLFVIIFSVFANKALKTTKKSRLKLGILTFVKFFDNYLRETFGEKKISRLYFPLVVGIFSIILFGNLFGLAIDWIGGSITPTILEYLRPMHSDLNTTLVLAFITVVSFLTVGVKAHGAGKTLKGYFFNYTGNNVTEKCVNVFVGWLHFIGIPATLASLSLRLFGNIFAGIVLISIITYLGALMSSGIFGVGAMLSIPFWFFEFFVALVQSIVFAALIMSYISQAKETH